MNERRVLFIVEGERGEPRLLRRMHEVLFGTPPGSIYWHGTVVYDLLRRIFEDGDAGDLDIVSVLRESVTDPERREVLKQEFTDVYLVFDMDPHDPRYDGELLVRAMGFFTESTENGKLYINYPMLESYRHLRSHDDTGYLDRAVSVDSLGGYKALVDREGHPDFKQLGRYDGAVFGEIIRMNVTKANRILNNERSLPDIGTFLSWRGSDILDAQIDLVASENRVYVLNTSVFYPVEFNPSRFLGSRTDYEPDPEGPSYRIRRHRPGWTPHPKSA